jgi:agmatinase
MIRTTAVVFPFDSFGNSGTGDGARLLGDYLREVAEDAILEPRPTRQQAFARGLSVQEVPFDTLADLTAWRETGRELVREQLADGDFLLWLSGNHLGVLPVYDELDPDDLVIQFDAHLDCYDLYDVKSELSHGNFLLHADRPPAVANVGHRDLFLPPKTVRQSFAAAVPATACDTATEVLSKRVKKAARVWIDIDADVFDPSACPGVHQPLPCGPTGLQVVGLLDRVWSDKVVGLSVSEFDPGRDVRDASLGLLGWLLEWSFLRRAEG